MKSPTIIFLASLVYLANTGENVKADNQFKNINY